MSHNPVKVTDTRAWLNKAANDVKAAEALIGEGLFDESAFHSQQAAEKAIKAFLFWNGVQFKKTHDLNLLTMDVHAIDAAFASFLVVIAPLTQFAVDYRYPGPQMPVTEADAESYRQIAIDVLNQVWSRLPFSP